jgi:cyclopropane fatty-acyl-phospholipid synthase-like methyltransferase
MATSIRKFMPKKEVLETSIEGFYIRALSIAESKEIAKAHSSLTEDDLKSESVTEELTMKLFDLACDATGEKFDEFASFGEIEKLSVEEFNAFANAIKDALVPSGTSEKK